MDGKSAPVDAVVAELAARQHGVVARRQLEALGLTQRQVETRIRLGRLHRIHSGVYAVGHPRVTWEGRLLAAVLTCGTGAVLSHRSAGAHWGVLVVTSGPIDVMVPLRHGRCRRAGLAIHRPRLAPTADEVAVERGIPVTTPARTLLDLACVLPPDRLRRAVERAEELRIFDLAAIEATLHEHPTSHGARRLRQAVAVADPALTRSELERRFLDLCREHAIPRPVVNAVVEGLEVDFFWPAARLVVETDGFEHHRTRAAFERDRERDALLARRGIRVLRFTDRQVTGEPATVAATVAALVA